MGKMSVFGGVLFVATSCAYFSIGSPSSFIWFYGDSKPQFVSTTSSSSSSSPCVIRLDALEVDPSASLRLRSHFDAEGYVIVRGVLSPPEVAAALSGVWSFVEAASAVKAKCRKQPTLWERLLQWGGVAVGIPRDIVVVERARRETWTEEAWPDALEGGIINRYGVGQSTVSWYVRSRRGVVTAFEEFWGQTDLITSFDGLILWRGSPWLTESGWFHVDQNPEKKPSFANVQGVVNLLHSSEKTGGNVLIRRSHSLFPSHYCSRGALPHYAARLQSLNGEDWLEIPASDPLLRSAFDRGDVITLELLPGDLLLWDSRTIHCSQPGHPKAGGAEGGEQAVAEADRAAVLVTMMPRSRVRPEVLRLRPDAIERGITATHWVDEAPAVLGAERGENRELEQERVKRMRDMGVILSLEGLTEAMMQLV